MPAEETQEQGRAGVQNVKRWLESSVRFSLPYNVYENTVRCTLATVNGVKRFDLKGDHYDEKYANPREIYIEVKTYKTDSGLDNAWKEFVATAYSATHVKWEELGRDPELEFMFASTHPWKPSSYWAATDVGSVREACEARADLMPDGGPVDDRLQAVADNLFLWVISKRQEDMTMGKKFRGWVMDRIANPPEDN